MLPKRGAIRMRCALVPSTGANIRIAFSNILEVLFSHLLKLTAEGKQLPNLPSMCSEYLPGSWQRTDRVFKVMR